MSATEFAGVGWAPGQVVGARSFKVDSLGRLTGVSFAQVWTPGENKAVCRKSEEWVGGSLNQVYGQLNQILYGIHFDGSRRGKWSEPIVEAKPLQHSLETCKCGFYGYYDGSNDYHAKDRVSGVVQGYGETLIGTRGFRCMKARIVALRIPKSVPVRLASLVARNYKDIPLFTSFKDMVAEFPPDGAGLEITPDSDAEFWTRSVS